MIFPAPITLLQFEKAGNLVCGLPAIKIVFASN